MDNWEKRAILSRHPRSALLYPQLKLGPAVLSSVSIDDALYHLSDFPEAVTLGKICIIQSILKAEGLSTLKVRPETGRLDTDVGRDGWAEQMFSMAISGLKFSDKLAQHSRTSPSSTSTMTAA